MEPIAGLKLVKQARTGDELEYGAGLCLQEGIVMEEFRQLVHTYYEGIFIKIRTSKWTTEPIALLRGYSKDAHRLLIIMKSGFCLP